MPYLTNCGSEAFVEILNPACSLQGEFCRRTIENADNDVAVIFGQFKEMEVIYADIARSTDDDRPMGVDRRIVTAKLGAFLSQLPA